MSLFVELKRRNVFRVGIAYAVVSWLLLQIADVFIDNIGAPDWVFPTLLMALAIGFPIALIFAWAFEMTPEGIKRESEVDRQTSITHQTGRRLDRAIIVVLALALAYFAWDKFSPAPDGVTEVAEEATSTEEAPPEATNDETSIAVLPFVNMSADEDNEYFSDGLSEELLNLLARMDGLKVAARTSSFKFKNSVEDITEIGAQLNVGTVLEGSVRKAGDQVRITAQLIKVDDGFHLWSQTYDRELDNIFAVQDEIATAIVEALRLPLLGEDTTIDERLQTANFEAYDLYLLGKHHAQEITGEGYEKAIDYFSRSVELDPNYVPARSELGMTYILASDFGDREFQSAMTLADDVISRALELDPDSIDALNARAMWLLYRSRYAEAIEVMERVLRSDPGHVGAAAQLARRLQFVDPDRALALAEGALERDPLADIVRTIVINTTGSALGPEAARARFAAFDAQDPNNPSLHEGIAFVEMDAGNIDLAIEHFEREWELRPGDAFPAYQIVRSLLMLGDDESAEAWVQRGRERAPDSVWVTRANAELTFFRGEYETLLGIMADLAEAGASNSTLFLGFVAETLVQVERHAEAEAYYRQALELLRADATKAPTRTEVRFLLPLASLLEPGPERTRLIERSKTLAELMQQQTRDSWRLTLLQARIAALEGDRDALFTALNSTVELGFRDLNSIETDPVFRTWRTDPQFREVIGRLNQLNEAILLRMAQAEANGGSTT